MTLYFVHTSIFFTIHNIRSQMQQYYSVPDSITSPSRFSIIKTSFSNKGRQYLYPSSKLEFQLFSWNSRWIPQTLLVVFTTISIIPYHNRWGAGDRRPGEWRAGEGGTFDVRHVASCWFSWAEFPRFFSDVEIAWRSINDWLASRRQLSNDGYRTTVSQSPCDF